MLAQKLGRYIDALDYMGLPAPVIHAAKRCLLDYLAAVIPGGIAPPAMALQAALADDLDHGKAALIPSGRVATPRTAALINGVASHTLEVDDIYRNAIYHPGPPVISAGIAALQSVEGSGRDLLVGIVAGYEISNRIGAAVQPSHYDYWHTTGTVGAFGAAAAAAKILGLTAAQTKHALANAATMAAGLQQAFRSDAMSKPLHAGRAAETGLLCAQMAAAGVTGADNMLEGERGFGNAMSRDVDWDAAFDGWGHDYTITRMTQKLHCCCGHTFAAIDAVQELRRHHKLSNADINSITVKSYRKALEVCGNTNPQTPYEAKFSLPYTVAMAALEGQLGLSAFADTWLKNEDVRELMSKVEILVSDEAEAAFPSQRSATVEIALSDGQMISHHAPTRRGDPDHPLTDQDLEDKFNELAGAVMAKDARQSVIDTVWTLEKQSRWVL